MKSKIIALSAISASFVAIVLTLGAYVEVVDLGAVVLSSIFVTLPLYLKSKTGSFLTYLAGGVIGFMISGFNIMSVVFPAYLAFFGIFPIVSAIMKEKKVNSYLIFFIGLVWCVAVIYGIYFYYTAVMHLTFNDLPLWISNNIYWVIAGISLIFYLLYERFLYVTSLLSNRYLQRIIK